MDQFNYFEEAIHVSEFIVIINRLSTERLPRFSLQNF